MARETRLWEWLQESWRKVPGLHVRRIENLVSSGDPDVAGCFAGSYFEIELKGLDRPARDTTDLHVGLRTEQTRYLEKRTACGGNAWVYIRVGLGRGLRRYLVPARFVQPLILGLTEAALAGLAELPGQHSTMDVLRHVTAREVKVDDTMEMAMSSQDVPALVVGMQYHSGSREKLKGLTQGSSLTLRREPENPYDSNAVAVWCGAARIGYLRRLDAEVISRRLDAGEPLKAVISCKDPVSTLGALPVVLRVIEDDNWDFLEG